jgi:hypothetical protein
MANNSNPLGNNGGRAYSFLNRPVIIDGSFVVDATAPAGVTGLKGAGFQNVYMHSSSPSASNPNPAVGFAMVQLSNNYGRYCGLEGSFVSPVTGSNLAINASALTAGQPYIITSVGAGTAGACTIAPLADVSKNLASTWFRILDAYGNVFIVWFSVDGVGSAPVGVSGILVQQSIVTNESAANVGAKLVITLAALPSGVSGVYSFTASGTTTVTVTSTKAVPLPGGPADGVIATGFAFALTKYKSNLQNWQEVGLQKGVQPAVGVAFIAIAVGSSTGGTSSGLVKLAGISGLEVEVVGDPNLSLSPGPMGGSPNVGGWIMLQFSSAGIAATPAAGQVVNLNLLVEASSIRIAGE